MATAVDKVAPEEQPVSLVPSAVHAPAQPPDLAGAKEDSKVTEEGKAAEPTAPAAGTKPAEFAAEAAVAANDVVVNGEKTPDAPQAPPVASGALLEEAKPVTKAPEPADAIAAPAPQPDHKPAENGIHEFGKEHENPTDKTIAAPALGAAEAPVANGDTGHDVPMNDKPGATMDAATSAPEVGDKRKADEPADTNGEVPEKKVKTDAGAEATTNGHDESAPKKVGRPKKDKKEKKEALPPGKTLRKTRSQGPA